MQSETIDGLRAQLLDAALAHIPFDGWTVDALERAASDLGLDELAVIRAFPGGSAELIRYHSRRMDDAMMDALADRNLDDLRVRERVVTGVRVRLELLAEQREAMRRALSFLAMPQNALLAMRCVYHTVDAIWHLAGDTATDWNFYSKRGLLAAVYTATVLYWLEDE
ncbi:MAG: COQ9 family protein, partial [Pirellulaceae bacterium]|nr:COQ9 family protein [Pirellulaceae bacterium]